MPFGQSPVPASQHCVVCGQGPCTGLAILPHAVRQRHMASVHAPIDSSLIATPFLQAASIPDVQSVQCRQPHACLLQHTVGLHLSMAEHPRSGRLHYRGSSLLPPPTTNSNPSQDRANLDEPYYGGTSVDFHDSHHKILSCVERLGLQGCMVSIGKGRRGSVCQSPPLPVMLVA